MAQSGQPRVSKPQEFSGCFCVVMGFIVGNVLFACVCGSLTNYNAAFSDIQMGTSRVEAIALLGNPKAESSVVPIPPGTYEHQDASRSGAKTFLLWRSRPFLNTAFVVGLDAQDATVFKCRLN